MTDDSTWTKHAGRHRHNHLPTSQGTFSTTKVAVFAGCIVARGLGFIYLKPGKVHFHRNSPCTNISTLANAFIAHRLASQTTEKQQQLEQLFVSQPIDAIMVFSYFFGSKDSSSTTGFLAANSRAPNADSKTVVLGSSNHNINLNGETVASTEHLSRPEHQRKKSVIVVETVLEDDDDEEYVVDPKDDIRVELFPRQDHPPPAQHVAAAAPTPVASPQRVKAPPERPVKAPFIRIRPLVLAFIFSASIFVSSYLTAVVINQLTGVNVWSNEIAFVPSKKTIVNGSSFVPEANKPEEPSVLGAASQANVSSGPSLDESNTVQDGGFGKGHTTTPLILPVDDLGILDLDTMDEEAGSVDHAQVNNNVYSSTLDMHVAEQDEIATDDDIIPPKEKKSAMVDDSFDSTQSEDVETSEADMTSTKKDATDKLHPDHEWSWDKKGVLFAAQMGFVFIVRVLFA